MRGRGRTLQVLVRPQEMTVLAEPAPSPCRDQQVNLVVAVVSAPANFLARSVIRWSSLSYDQHLILHYINNFIITGGPGA